MSNVEKLPKPSSWWFAASHLQQNNGCCLITNSAVDFLVQQNLFWNQPICQCSTIRVFTGFTIHQIEFPCNIRKIKTNSHPGNSVLFRTLKAVLNRAIVFFLLSSRNKAIATSYYLLQKKDYFLRRVRQNFQHWTIFVATTWCGFHCLPNDILQLIDYINTSISLTLGKRLDDRNSINHMKLVNRPIQNEFI